MKTNRFLLALILLFTSHVSFATEQLPVEHLDQVIAIVNNGVITESELTQQIQLLENQLANSATPRPDKAILKKQVLNHLIDVDLQLQLAKRLGMSVDKLMLDNAITDIAKKSNMTTTQLRKAVEARHMPFTEYRNNIRKQMLIAQLQQELIGKKVAIQKEEVDKYLQQKTQQIKNQQQYHVKNILIPLPESPTPAQVSQAKKQAYRLLKTIRGGTSFSKAAIERSSGYSALQGGDLGWRKLAELPTLFVPHLTHMKIGEVAEPIQTANGFHLIKLIAIKKARDKNTVTVTQVRHILLKNDANHSSEDNRETLLKLRKKIIKGASFATLARQYSDDLRSKNKGGDLGWVRNGELVPEFAKAMNEVHIKKISQPIKTQFGWHLIQVLNRRNIDVSKQLLKRNAEQLLYRREFEKAVKKWLTELRAKSYIKILSSS